MRYLVCAILGLVLIFGLTLWGRKTECRIALEFDPMAGFRSHSEIDEECEERNEFFLLFR